MEMGRGAWTESQGCLGHDVELEMDWKWELVGSLGFLVSFFLSRQNEETPFAGKTRLRFLANKRHEGAALLSCAIRMLARARRNAECRSGNQPWEGVSQVSAEGRECRRVKKGGKEGEGEKKKVNLLCR